MNREQELKHHALVIEIAEEMAELKFKKTYPNESIQQLDEKRRSTWVDAELKNARITVRRMYETWEACWNMHHHFKIDQVEGREYAKNRGLLSIK